MNEALPLLKKITIEHLENNLKVNCELILSLSSCSKIPVNRGLSWIIAYLFLNLTFTTLHTVGCHKILK